MVNFLKIFIFKKIKFIIVLVLETMSENINQFVRMVSELLADVRSILFGVLCILGPASLIILHF